MQIGEVRVLIILQQVVLVYADPLPHKAAQHSVVKAFVQQLTSDFLRYNFFIRVCLSSRGSIASNPWDNNFWLDLDFLDVARAAQRCSAYFTSLLYIEIWRGTAERERSVSSGRQRYEDTHDLANEDVRRV